MNITNVKINIPENSKVLAYATVTIEDCIVISGIRLYKGSKGNFLVFPSKITQNGRRFHITFPCSNEIRENLLNEIQNKYKQEIEK